VHSVLLASYHSQQQQQPFKNQTNAQNKKGIMIIAIYQANLRVGRAVVHLSVANAEAALASRLEALRGEAALTAAVTVAETASLRTLQAI
jgi:hypothetical protein